MKYKDLTQEEQISAYLDNQLPNDMVDKLINNINSNAHLSEEFKQLSSIGSMFDRKHTIDASTLKDPILAGIGLSNASVSQISKYSIILYSLLLLLVSVGGFFAFNHILDNNNRNIIIAKSINNKQTTSIKQNENIIGKTKLTSNDVTSNDITSNEVIATKQSNLLSGVVANNKTIHPNTIIANDDENSYNNDYSDNNLSENISVNRIITSIPQLPIDNNNNSILKNIENIITVGKSMLNTFEGITTNKILNMEELSYIYFYSNPEIFEKLHLTFNWYNLSNNVPQLSLPETNGLFRNLSMSLQYEINSNNLIGIAAGYDKFLMQFDRWEGQNQYQYSQEFITEWIGISYTHNFAPIGYISDKYKIYPFSSLSLSYMKIGGHSALNTGIGIDISQTLSLNLGLNTGILLYQFDNKYWTSYKYGINFGMNINL